MNVTEMQKVNDLSRELMKQGMAASSEDASRMAHSIIGKESTLIDLHEKVPKPNVEMERYERKMGKHMEMLANQMKLMAEQIQYLKQDIQRLKSQPAPVQALAQTQPVQQPQSAPVQQATQPVQAPQTTRPEGSKPSSRTGNFKPGDVNIEDYFYCGQK